MFWNMMPGCLGVVFMMVLVFIKFNRSKNPNENKTQLNESQENDIENLKIEEKIEQQENLINKK